MRKVVTLSTKIVAIVAVVLAVSGSYAGFFHDQSIKAVYSSLEPQVYDLKNQIDTRDAQISQLKAQVSKLEDQVASLNALVSSLQGQNNDLKTQITTLRQQVSDLQTTIDDLQRASVDGWFTFDSTQCYYSCNVRGAYANFGTQAARSVVLTLTWKNNGAFVQSNTVSLANLAGRTVALYPATASQQYFSLAAPANQLSWSFTWTA